MSPQQRTPTPPSGEPTPSPNLPERLARSRLVRFFLAPSLDESPPGFFRRWIPEQLSIRPEGDLPQDRAVALSLVAVAAAVGGEIFLGQAVPEVAGFIWVLLLIPPFLLSHYRGWSGAGFALALGMVALTGVEVVVEPLLGNPVAWNVYAIGSTAYLLVTLGTGVTSELLQGFAGDPREGWRIIEYDQILRKALEKDEFVLHYQPLVASSTGRVTGAEALIRWDRDGRGLVSPGEFIPMAEKSGFIVPLGRWVVEEALSRMELWRERFGHDHPFRLHVNVSPLELAEADYPDFLAGVLSRHGVKPRRLEIEVTESVLMAEEDAVRDLKELGVSVALDDFGTGYSCLQSLHHLSVDRVKIDLSFVADLPGDETLVRTIVDLAGNLEIETLAEGVETREQLASLLRLGCDELQGYYFAHPEPISAEPFPTVYPSLERYGVGE